jgi:uncharacterized Zn-finger protein
VLAEWHVQAEHHHADEAHDRRDRSQDQDPPLVQRARSRALRLDHRPLGLGLDQDVLAALDQLAQVHGRVSAGGAPIVRNASPAARRGPIKTGTGSPTPWIQSSHERQPDRARRPRSAGAALIPANAENRYDVRRADLPLSCPMPGMHLWNSHPRVYLPVEANGSAKCPYCGAVYRLVD